MILIAQSSRTKYERWYETAEIHIIYFYIYEYLID